MVEERASLSASFLRDIPPQALDLILPLMTERAFQPGQTLFHEGELHQDLHIVIEGHVRLDMAVPNRGRISLLTVGPGDVLAWSAVLSPGWMTTSALAMDRVRTTVLNGIELQQLCESHPDIGFHVMKQLAVALSRRLVATRLQLLDLFAEHQPVPPVLGPHRAPADLED